MSEQTPAKPNQIKEILASPAARALIALALVLIVGTVFNADGAFFKFGTGIDTLRQASVCISRVG
ncbi:MAG: hypothetical protein U1F83_08355 [Verrucomicrobiota bacterium]